ncbi:MAG: hypothetical protein H7A35_05045 [Planctomycetales bacterium]|nr:hypothetical protein [bacterium]UNM09424.1 MAG: hypothetical protein H7A35_05045 [Planctomycetales bacterium]
MKCPACGASNGPGRSTCSSCMRPLGNQAQAESSSGPKYRSWTEESGKRPGYVAPSPSEMRQEEPQISAQNLDPAVAQEYYRQQTMSGYGENSSGMGAAAGVPADAQGFTAAGCVPFGLFAFANGQVALGIVGLIVCWIPVVSTLYALYIGQKGKELAWQGRRFNDINQFNDTMSAWNIAGWICLFLDKILYVIFVIGGGD